MQAHEALRRAKFKFPGRQKIVDSRNWCAPHLVESCLVILNTKSPLFRSAACSFGYTPAHAPLVRFGSVEVSAMCRGFTKFARDDYLQWKKEGRLVNDGVNAKVRAAVSVTPGVFISGLLQGAAGASGISLQRAQLSRSM